MAAADAGRKLALLIAVHGYGRFGPDWRDLDGTLNDIALIKDVLTKRYGFAPSDITMVCDDTTLCTGQPTRAGIIGAFESLIQRARPGDVVYIQYSGHGSTVKDENGDEPDGRDSTWVPIDARDTGSSEILDDEIAIWLGRLSQKTPDIVLVSDSCHSGTITRGARSSKSRGAPTRDTREYPWSRAITKEQVTEAQRALLETRFVRVSAALDAQLAYEYQAPDARSYGRLTWFWAQALTHATPGETYAEVFRSMVAMMPGDDQQPVLEGSGGNALFDRRFVAHPRQIAVTNVTDRVVEFSEGVLSGVTSGSTFQRRDQLVSVVIDRVDAYSARGTILDGAKVEPGDLFNETQHAYRLPPLRVMVRADHPKDEPVQRALTKALRERLADGIVVVSESEHADVILHLARVGRDAAGTFTVAADGLPTRDAPFAPLECWILDETEALYGPTLRIAMQHAGATGYDRAVDEIVCDVDVIVRNRGIVDVANLGADELTGTVVVDAFRPSDPRPGDVDLVEIQFDDAHGGRKRQRLDPLQPSASADIHSRLGDCVTFRAANHSSSPRYFYLLNVVPSGAVKVMFPDRGNDKDGLVGAGAVRTFTDATYQLDGPRDVYLWFITDEPAPVWALEAAGYCGARGNRGADFDATPLGQLFGRAARGVRGQQISAAGPKQFAVRKIVFRVQ